MYGYKAFLLDLADSIEGVLNEHDPNSSCFLCYVLESFTSYPEKYVTAAMTELGYSLHEDDEFRIELTNRIGDIESAGLAFSGYLAKEAGECPDEDGRYAPDCRVTNLRRVAWLRAEAERV